MPLCVQLDVEKFLQADVTAEPEAQVTYLIENAGAEIEAYLHRTVEEQAVVTELHDGNGDYLILLEHWPVTIPLTTVVEDGTTLIEGTDYVAYEDGRVYRGTATFKSRWRGGLRAVDFDYTGGYDTVPFLIRDVCARMVARAFQAGAAYANTPVGAAGIKEISLDDSDSVKYTDAVSDVSGAAVILNDDEKMMLNRFRRQVFV